MFRRVLSLELIVVLIAAVAALNVQGAVKYGSSAAHTDTPTSHIKFKQFKAFTKRHSIRHARQANPDPDTTSTNITNMTIVEDDHDYYTSVYYPPGSQADDLWFELTDRSNSEVVIANISDNFRYYSVFDLPFEFQFYGHTVTEVGVSTGGFLYVGPWFHSYIHLSQFIAPLQGDFNPGINDTALIYIYQDDNRYTVQWDQVHNHDHVDDGPFTFQVSLFRNGTIHFVYKDIPLRVPEINNDDHPVFVGLADSFYFDTLIPGGFISRTIYEYHRIQLNATIELSNTAYVITPVPNCISETSCEACRARTQTSSFNCGWCEQLNRCSDGIDRHRQEWFGSGCFIERMTICQVPTTEAPTTMPTTSRVVETTTTTTTTSSDALPDTTKKVTTAEPSTTTSPTMTPTTTAGSPSVEQVSSSIGTGPTIAIVVVVIILLILILLVTAAIVVLWYGYKKPTSSIGLFMIEHRPKARTLNKTAEVAYNVETGKAALSNEYS